MADRTLVTTFDANIQAFEQKIDRMQRKLNELSATFQKAEQATQSMDKTGEAVQKQGQQVDETNKKLDQHEKNLKKQNKQQKQNNQTINRGTKETENWLSSYSESIQIAVRSTALWGVATTAIYGTKRAMEEMHQVMMDVNSEMVALRRVMDELSTDFDEIQKQATTLGVDLAKNVDEVVKAMVQWGRQGKEQVEVIELTEAALLAANVAQMDAKQAVDLLTAAILQFNKDAAEGVEIVDKLNETANNYATTATDLAMSIRESGAAANNAGIAMDELIGMTTALQAATAKSGNRIGRALRTIFSRILGDMRNTGEAVGRVEVMLNSVGIALRQSEDDYRSMTDVITDLASKWDELSEVQQANIARAMGGRRRYSDVISLIENWDMALDATETSFNSLGSAIEENEKYMDSMEAHWKQAQARFESLSLTIGELGAETLSKRFANALGSVYQDIEETVIGLRHLEEQNKAVTWSLRIIASTIAVQLTPALQSLAATIMAHPALTAAVLGTMALTYHINKIGEYQQSLSEARKERKAFNDILERGNQLSLEEVQQTDELIDKHNDLISVYQKMQNELDNQSDSATNFYEIMSGAEGVLADPIKDLLAHFGSEGAKNIHEGQEAIEKLRLTHKDLSKQFENDEEFVDAVLVKMRDYRDELEDTVSWIGKYSMEQYETTKQGVRENQMLQEKIDRYQELASQSERNVEQEAEMQQLIRELEADWPELAAADDFDIALEDLGTDKMEEFGREGERVQKTIRDLEKDLNVLKDAESDLSDEKQNLAQEIEKIEKAMRIVDPNTAEYVKMEDQLKKTRKEYIDITDQIDETIESQADIEDALKDLKGTTDDFDPEQFLASWAEVQKVFGDLKDDVRDVGVEIKDLKTNLRSGQDLLGFESELLGLSPL
ncbi:MAG: phage tail tape measure protein, partial [Bacteroidales bacterium]